MMSLPDIRQFAENQQTRVLKLEISEQDGWSGIYPSLKMHDSPEMRPVWEAVHDCGLIVTFGFLYRSGL